MCYVFIQCIFIILCIERFVYIGYDYKIKYLIGLGQWFD